MADNDEVVVFLGLGAFITFLIGFFSVFNTGANAFGIGFVLLSFVLLFSAIQVGRSGSVKRSLSQSPIPATMQEPVALSQGLSHEEPAQPMDSPQGWSSEPSTVEAAAAASESRRWSPPPWQAAPEPQQTSTSETDHSAVEPQ